jgi:nucleotide-binding universal stress UspA family protein
MQMSKKFLVAVDGSDHSWKALDLAAKLANLSDAELVILHVVPYEPMPDALKQFASSEGIPLEEEDARFHSGRKVGDKIASEAEARARKGGLDRVTALVIEGKAAEEISTMAKTEGIELLFLGSRGLSDVSAMLMGSISHKVMHLAPCTCVVVK